MILWDYHVSYKHNVNIEKKYLYFSQVATLYLSNLNKTGKGWGKGKGRVSEG